MFIVIDNMLKIEGKVETDISWEDTGDAIRVNFKVAVFPKESAVGTQAGDLTSAKPDGV